MTNKEAIKILSNYHNGYFGYKIDDVHTAHTLAIKALETVDDVNYKVYRNEECDRAGKCIDYIGWHCAGCNGAKESKNDVSNNK